MEKKLEKNEMQTKFVKKENNWQKMAKFRFKNGQYL